MAQAAHAHDHHGSHGDGGGHGHGAHHAPMYYVKIWAILLALLCVSIMGPMLGNKLLTIFTAFGIALVKAAMVCAFFMHLNVEKKYIWYLMFGMLAMVGMFWFGVVADVNKGEGRNWTKVTIPAYIETLKKQAEEFEHEEQAGTASEKPVAEHLKEAEPAGEKPAGEAK
jgi:caa(3)-type oxidase subunit IV